LVSKSGVPQGSHLGPLLFLLFINDVVSIFESLSVLLYEDDMKLYVEIGVIEDCYVAQRDLVCLYAWCDVNKLYLNVRKCKVIIFSRAKVQVTYDYSLNGQNLERVSVIRDLGVLMDSKLTFSKHVYVTVSKARQMLGIIMRVGRDFRDPYALKFLYVYFCMVRSKLEYASCVWMPYQNGRIAG
jgi:ribonucleases P/MRP protein subunit RPP40